VKYRRRGKEYHKPYFLPLVFLYSLELQLLQYLGLGEKILCFLLSVFFPQVSRNFVKQCSCYVTLSLLFSFSFFLYYYIFCLRGLSYFSPSGPYFPIYLPLYLAIVLLPTPELYYSQLKYLQTESRIKKHLKYLSPYSFQLLLQTGTLDRDDATLKRQIQYGSVLCAVITTFFLSVFSSSSKNLSFSWLEPHQNVPLYFTPL
jgi:hypothetical protein